ncbi:MAG: methylmalonyl Co-A mutase-associated GTPase MeaB [candidate division WOR-3 bacterium]
MSESTTDLIRAFQKGDRRACGRLMSLVENGYEEAVVVLDQLYSLTGRAYRIGVTGPPGAGKSTIVEKLALTCRKAGGTVGIVAVDPTSPFSGGAVLGDRVRMSSLFNDPGVYIRSMATRGGMGGLAARTKEVCDLLDAFGRDFIIIETVGVGQMELDIADAAHSTVVVLVPESGDSIQALKAGLMEIADIYCVNKADREGADRLVLEIEGILELRPRNNGWNPPVLKTVATSGQGIERLYEQLLAHRAFVQQSGLDRLKREQTVRNEIQAIVDERLRREHWARQGLRQRLDRLVQAVLSGSTTPYRAAQELIGESLSAGAGATAGRE